MEELAEVSGGIHISFDLWTSTNSIAMLGVVVHYLDRSGKGQRKLIGLPRVRGSHGGENLTPSILGMLRMYKIERKIGLFQADNADSNDRCIVAVLRDLMPEEDPDTAKRLRRVRCLAHPLPRCARTARWK